MSGKSIVLIGAGGHCRSCIDVIESTGDHCIAGIIDTDIKVGQEISGYKIIGTDNDCEALIKKGHQFLITIGNLKLIELRKSIFEKLISMGASMATIVSPRAYVSRTAAIGIGTIVMHDAFVNTFAKVSDNCIINTGAAVEHDSTIGNHCHISTFSVVNGASVVDDKVFAGSRSVVANGVKIASGTIIGAGAVIHKSIEEAGTYVGNPCRRIS